MRTGIAALALIAAACSRSAGDANWLTDPGFAGHAKFFPLVGTAHDGIDCNSCHLAPATAPAFTTFAQVDCVTCHFQQATTPDAIHIGNVGGYVSPTAAGAPASPWPYSGQMCLGCHPNGTSTMPNHGAFFPIGSGTSHALGCGQCHGNILVKQDISKQQCNVCHAANDPNLATAHSQSAIGKDYSASAACGGASATTCPQSCLGCHALDLLQPVATHPSMKVPHQGATCLVCHDLPLRTDLVASPVPPSTASQPYAVDFASDPSACGNLASKTGCYNCHNTCPPTGN